MKQNFIKKNFITATKKQKRIKFYQTNSISRLDMCRRNYPTDVCNRGTAGNIQKPT